MIVTTESWFGGEDPLLMGEKRRGYVLDRWPEAIPIRIWPLDGVDAQPVNILARVT